LDCLPEGVEEVKLRSDTAGYQHDLLKYCEKGENKRFGRIEFAIGCNVTQAFKTAVAQVPDSEWHSIYEDRVEKGRGQAASGLKVALFPMNCAIAKMPRNTDILPNARFLKRTLYGGG